MFAGSVLYSQSFIFCQIIAKIQMNNIGGTSLGTN